MVAFLPLTAGLILVGGLYLHRQGRWIGLATALAVIGALGLAAYAVLLVWSYVFPIY